jgi:hypothetical protein
MYYFIAKIELINNIKKLTESIDPKSLLSINGLIILRNSGYF